MEMDTIKIEVLMTPQYHDNKYKPYFWAIMKLSSTSGEYYNSGLCGWAETPADAWKEAYQDYLRFEDRKF